MAKRLLDRQVSLLNYLTSGSAIFGDKRDDPLDPALRGIDSSLLRIEARFSHDKRMEKIIAVFPKTFALLGADRETLVRDFVDACPPMDISRLENARQFHAFLRRRWHHEPPIPPYLRDVAACELACAKARDTAESRALEANEGAHTPARGHIRRHPGVILLRTAYDIRPMFEDTSAAAVPMERDTMLAFTLSSGGDEPSVLELVPEIFDLLAVLEKWTDPGTFDVAPQAHELIADLAQAGLVEVRR
jgi:hypothetical protein